MNGQAKIDFFSKYNFDDLYFDLLTPLYQNALKIEWFDSVNIFIHVDNLTNCYDAKMNKKWNAYIKIPYTNRKKVFEWADNREKATEKALEKATELYNLKFKKDE